MVDLLIVSPLPTTVRSYINLVDTNRHKEEELKALSGPQLGQPQMPSCTYKVTV